MPNALAKEDVPLAERPAGARAEFALQLLRVLQDELGVFHRLLLGTSQLLERSDQPVPRVERLETHPMGVSCNSSIRISAQTSRRKKKKKERISKVKISKVTDQINLFLQGLFFKKEIKNLDERFFFFFLHHPSLPDKTNDRQGGQRSDKDEEI